MSDIAFTPEEGLSPRTIARQQWKREMKQTLWRCTNSDCLNEVDRQTFVVERGKCPNCGSPMQRYNPYKERRR